jgi:RNA polymerase sigma-70 factor (ECF subfamily)
MNPLDALRRATPDDGPTHVARTVSSPVSEDARESPEDVSPETRASLLRFARSLTRDHAAAEDLVQDTLMTTWRKRVLFENRGSFSGFAKRVAYRLFLNGLQKSSRRERLGERDVTCARQTPCDEVLRRHAVQAFSKELAKALDALPEAQRIAFEMFHFEESTCPEIAARIGIPVKTAETRVRRATLKLAETLREHKHLLQPRSEP